MTSILGSRDQDPHAFQPGPATARALAGAHVVIYNGGGYDPWMPKLLGGPSKARQVVVVADALRQPKGVNPHFWFDPAAAPVIGAAITDALILAGPEGTAEHRQRLAAFQASLSPLNDAVARFRVRHGDAPVTATEPSSA